MNRRGLFRAMWTGAKLAAASAGTLGGATLLRTRLTWAAAAPPGQAPLRPPGALPEDWRELERRRVPGTGLRVIAVADRIGLYGETLGPLPMGWSDAALEEVVVWQAQ